MTLGLTCCFIHTNFPLDLLSKILNQFSESVLHTVHTSRQFSLWLLFTYITFTKFMPAISLSFFLFLPLFPSFLFLFSLWPHRQHMEVPRLGIKSELQLPAYTTATALLDLSHIYDLHHSFWQCWILNLLGKFRDRTCILRDTMLRS